MMRSSGSVLRRGGLALAAAGAVALGAGAVSASAASGPAASAKVPACATSQLTVWMGIPGDGTAGSSYYELELSNTSSATCNLYGFPGVSGAGPGGKQLGSAASWNHAETPSTVVLSPGATAHVVVRIIDVYNFPSATCAPAAADGLRVYPPNQKSSVEVPFSFEACSKAGPIYLQAGPVTAGTGIPGYSN
jgi:hypothetical protein